MRQKDAAVLSKAAAESEEGSGDGRETMSCRCSPNECLPSSSCSFSALSFCVCSEGSTPFPNHPFYPQPLESEALLVHSSPAPGLASSDSGRTPLPAAQMSQRPDFAYLVEPLVVVISKMTQRNTLNLGRHIRVGKEAWERK